MCTKPCKDYEITLAASTEAPIVGSVQISELQSSNQPNQSFENSNRYYTIGSFGAGPQQNLLVRLLNIVRKDSLDKLIVLAKPKGQEENEEQESPVIIDTANVFSFNISDKELATEIHTVDGSKIPQAVDLELTSKIDHDLDMAIKEKRRKAGKGFLTAEEMDKIIDHALSMVSKMFSNVHNKLVINFLYHILVSL